MATVDRVSQVVVESLNTDVITLARVSQVVVEALSGYPTVARISQVVVETLSKQDPCAAPPDGEDVSGAIGPLLWVTWDGMWAPE